MAERSFLSFPLDFRSLRRPVPAHAHAQNACSTRATECDLCTATSRRAQTSIRTAPQTPPRRSPQGWPRGPQNSSWNPWPRPPLLPSSPPLRGSLKFVLAFRDFIPSNMGNFNLLATSMTLLCVKNFYPLLVHFLH